MPQQHRQRQARRQLLGRQKCRRLFSRRWLHHSTSGPPPPSPRSEGRLVADLSHWRRYRYFGATEQVFSPRSSKPYLLDWGFPHPKIPLALYAVDDADADWLRNLSEWDREQEMQSRFLHAVLVVRMARRNVELRNNLSTLELAIYNNTSYGSPGDVFAADTSILPTSLSSNPLGNPSPMLPRLSSALPSPFRNPPFYLRRSLSELSTTTTTTQRPPSAGRRLPIKRERSGRNIEREKGGGDDSCEAWDVGEYRSSDRRRRMGR